MQQRVQTTTLWDMCPLRFSGSRTIYLIEKNQKVSCTPSFPNNRFLFSKTFTIPVFLILGNNLHFIQLKPSPSQPNITNTFRKLGETGFMNLIILPELTLTRTYTHTLSQPSAAMLYQYNLQIQYLYNWVSSLLNRLPYIVVNH